MGKTQAARRKGEAGIFRAHPEFAVFSLASCSLSLSNKKTGKLSDPLPSLNLSGKTNY